MNHDKEAKSLIDRIATCCSHGQCGLPLPEQIKIEASFRDIYICKVSQEDHKYRCAYRGHLIDIAAEATGHIAVKAYVCEYGKR